MRFFNRMGPVDADQHYVIPPLSRVDLDEILTLIRQRAYLVLHAPRQTGKTTILLALRDLLNSGSEGDYRCVYASLEAGRTANGDVERAMRSILGEIGARAEDTLDDDSVGRSWQETLAFSGPDRALRAVLGRWAAADPRPPGIGQAFYPSPSDPVVQDVGRADGFGADVTLAERVLVGRAAEHRHRPDRPGRQLCGDPAERRGIARRGMLAPFRVRQPEASPAVEKEVGFAAAVAIEMEVPASSTIRLGAA